VKSGISEVFASFRTGFRRAGPKDDGPLSRMTGKDMDTE